MATNRSDIILGAQNRTSAELRNVARDLRTAASEAQRAERQFSALERGIDALRDSEIRAARASGDYGRAIQLIDGELSRTQEGTVRYNNLLAQQATATKQAEGGTRSFGGALSAIQQGLGAIGIGLGVQQLVQFGIGAFQTSQQLKGTEASLRVLAGDTTRYNQVLDLARQNQSQYGGTLQENISQLTGFTVAARRAGVGVAQLNDLSKRLAVLSPEQGAAGASIAINEALSGNASSLVRRFEIPKQLLKGLEDQSTTTAQKLAILSDALDKSGVSAEAVAASTTDAERAVNRAAAAFDTLKTNVGDASAPAVERLATGLSRVLGLINQNPQAIAELKAILAGKSGVSQDDLKQTTADVARSQVSNQLTGSTPGGTDYRTQSRFKEFTPDRQKAIIDTLTRAKVAGGDLGQQADQLLQSFVSAKGGTADFARQVDQLGAATTQTTNQISAQRPEIQSLTDRNIAATAALREQFTASQDAADAQNKLAFTKKGIADLADKVVGGYESEKDALTELTLQFGDAELAARLLNNEIGRITSLTVAQGLTDQRTGERSGGQFKSQAEADAAAAGDKARAARARDLAAAQAAQIQATGTATQKLAALRAELAQLPKGTDLYVKKQTEVIAAEQAVAQERQQNAQKAQTQAEKAQRSAEEIRKARFDLLSTEQQIADLRQRVASGRLSEVDRLDATKQIKDLEQKITDEREKQVKSSIDARLAALDDRKQQRIELREAAAAQRILASGSTSGEQKASAADVLQRIALEQQKRALEIAEKTRDAGGVVPGAPGVSAALPSGGQRVGPVVAPLPGGAGAAVAVVPIGTGAAAGADISQQLLDALKQITFTAYIDGKPVSGQLVATLRSGLAAARSAGVGKG